MRHHDMYRCEKSFTKIAGVGLLVALSGCAGGSTLNSQPAAGLSAAPPSLASKVLQALATPNQRAHLGSPWFMLHVLGLAPGKAEGRATHKFSQSYGEQVVVFNAPGASNQPFNACAAVLCGTVAYSANDLAFVTGYFNDSNVVEHGFIRSPLDGGFETFDVSGAGNQPGQGTFPYAMNDTGQMAGNIQTNGNVYHAFIRGADGDVTLYDVPGAGTGAFEGTIAECINQRGDTAGIYYDQNDAEHAFMRTRDRVFTTFDAPSAVATYPASPACLTEKDDIAGTYFDAAGNGHAFLRTANGNVLTIDPPNASTPVYGNAINDAGTVVGGYLDDSGNPPPTGFHGFLRKHDGTFVQLDVPGGVGTDAHSINLPGTTAGEFSQHPFVRSAQGGYLEYLVPGTVGAFPQQINLWNIIAGDGYNAESVSQGYIALPSSQRRSKAFRHR